MRINLPTAEVISTGGGGLATICSECHHTPKYCFCATETKLSRAELNTVALGLLFGYDLSQVPVEVQLGVRDVLKEVIARVA